jgi:hypothetical protein
MNQEKLVVLTLFALLLLPLAFSAEPVVVTNPLPTFVVTYDESSAPVTIESVRLRDLFTNLYDLSGPVTYPPGNPYKFNYTSTRYLTNKDYIFTINALDIEGNPREDTIHIIVDVDYMPIYVTSPLSPLFSDETTQDFAVGTSLPFTLELRTADDVICRIKTSSLGGQEPLAEWNSAATSFNDGDLTPTKNHEISVVTDAQGDNTVLPGRALNYNNLFLNSYLVVCKQNAEPEPVYHLKEIYVGYDLTPPEQTVTFTPDFMEDYADVSTAMSIFTTGDLVMCDYALAPAIPTEPASSLPSPLTGFADLFSITNKTFDFNTYKQALEFNTPYEFTLTTNCTNPAGLWNEVAESFTIQLSTLLRMTLAETHFSVPKPTLSLTTNLASTCWYEDDGVITNFTSANRLTHTFSALSFEEGTTPFSVSCLSEQGVLETRTFSIVIDSKAPLAPIIKSGKDLCEPRFELHLGAPDPRDSVAYNVSLYTGTTTSADNRIAGPEQTSFTDRDVLFTTGSRPTPTINQSYTWEVYAIDRAGNKGTTVKHTITSVPFDSLTCDVTPPRMRTKAEKMLTGYEVNITCSDAESGCANSFRLSTIATNETCDFTKGVATPYTAIPLLIEEDAQLCYVGSDNAGNEKTGKLVLELDNLQLIEQLCENGFKDTDEEGIDCGGVCPDECPEEELDEYELGQEDDDQDDDQDDAQDDDTDSVTSCLDNFDCPPGELCVQGICKPDSSQSAKDSFLPWLLIILGIFFIIGGVGYIVYAEKQKQEYAKQKARYQQSSQETAAMAAKRLADEKKYLEELKKKRLAGEQKRSKLSEEKKSERSKLLDAFAADETESDETEKEATPSSLTDEASQSSFPKEAVSKKDSSSLTKSPTQEPSKLDEGLTDEFVLLDDLGKPKKDGSTDSPSSKDVFSDLQKLNKKAKDIKKDKPTQEDTDETSTN